MGNCQCGIDESETRPRVPSDFKVEFPEMTNYMPGELPAEGMKVLLVGVTGGTGQQVVKGFLDAAKWGVCRPGTTLCVLTRSPHKPAAKALEALGCTLIKGDLDDPESLVKACDGVHAVYCHGTSADSASADPVEVDRARSLAKACLMHNVGYMVYNSAGGADRDSGIRHIEQKAAIEGIFKGVGIPCTNLRATLFMEELWKKYTRPAILGGSFKFAMPPAKKQQYICCRDMGYAASVVLADTASFLNEDIEIAGDELTCPEMAEAFSAAQKAKELPEVAYAESGTWFFWLISRELYALIIWYQEKGYQADVAKCRERFPKLTTFAGFLEQTQWADQERTYETLDQ